MPEHTVAVVGLGYVGLPLACVLAETGLKVHGIEKSADRVAVINRGQCPIVGDEPGLAGLIEKVVRSGQLKATSSPEVLKECGAVFVCVDTPIDEQHQPNLASLQGAVRDVGRRLAKGTLVSIESTIPPLTMSNLVIPALEKESGLKAGRDFSVAHCPERVMPGKLLHNLRYVNRVLGGLDKTSLDKGLYYYTRFVQDKVHTTDLLTAEITKTTENAYRDVQIAFANEVALLCESVGANAFEVRKMVNTCPYRDMHIPGSGVGGYCLPKDPWLLLSSAPDLEARVIPAAREINEFMPQHLVDLALQALASRAVKRKPKVAIMGLAFLRDSDDVRNTPAVPVIDLLMHMADLTVHDPFVREGYKVPLNRDIWDSLDGADCAIFVTDHSCYAGLDLEKIRKKMRTSIIVDGRNIFDGLECKKHGITYRAIGKG